LPAGRQNGFFNIPTTFTSCLVCLNFGLRDIAAKYHQTPICALHYQQAPPSASSWSIHNAIEWRWHQPLFNYQCYQILMLFFKNRHYWSIVGCHSPAFKQNPWPGSSSYFTAVPRLLLPTWTRLQKWLVSLNGIRWLTTRRIPNIYGSLLVYCAIPGIINSHSRLWRGFGLGWSWRWTIRHFKPDRHFLSDCRHGRCCWLRLGRHTVFGSLAWRLSSKRAPPPSDFNPHRMFALVGSCIVKTARFAAPRIAGAFDLWW
jgi:hypothetical protein